MKTKRIWKKVIVRVLTTVMLVFVFSTVDMGWNVREVKAADSVVEVNTCRGTSDSERMGYFFYANNASGTTQSILYCTAVNRESGGGFSTSTNYGLYAYNMEGATFSVEKLPEGYSVTKYEMTILNGPVRPYTYTYYGDTVYLKVYSSGGGSGFIFDSETSGRNIASIKLTLHKCDGASVIASNKIPERAATCIEDGYKAYWKCSCGKVYAPNNFSKSYDDESTWKNGEGKLAKESANHAFNYTSSNNIITAKCSRSGCTHNSTGITLTLNTNDATYTGSAYTGASIGNWSKTGTILGLASRPITISYTNQADTATYSSNIAPTNVGNYTASITVGSAKAKKNFSITKKDVEASDLTVECSNSVYNGEAKLASTSVASGKSGLGDITVKYQKQNGSDWETATTEAPINAGTYRVLVSTAEGSNFNATSSDLTDDFWEFTIAKKQITINPTEGQEKNFGEDDPVFKYNFDENALIGDDEITGALGRETGENVVIEGYAYTVDTLSAGNNYALKIATDAPKFYIKKLDSIDSPAPGEGYILDYDEERLSAKPDTEYEIGQKDEDGNFVPIYSPIDLEPGDTEQTYYVRYKDNDNHPKSDLTPITIAPRPTKPDESEVLERLSDSITLKAIDGVEYSIDGGTTWITGTDEKVKFNSLTPDYEYTVKSRVKATGTAPRSEETEQTVKTKKAFPPTVEGRKNLFDITLPEDGNPIYNKEAKEAEVKLKDGAPTGGIGTPVVKYYDKDGKEVKEPTDAGEYTVKVTTLPTDDYPALPETELGKFTIAQKQITISGVKAKDKVYDGNTKVTFDYSNVEYTGIIDGDKLTVEAEGNFADKVFGENKNVSITKLTLGGASANNYVLEESGQQDSDSANITQREAELNWGDTSFNYDEQEKKPTATVENLVSNDTCIVTVELVDVSVAIDAGNYKAKATGLTGDDSTNYKLPANTEKAFTINKINQPEVTVSMPDYAYSANPVPSPSVSDNAKENPSITYYYSLENKKTGGTEWKNIAPESIEPDTYYMYAVLATTTNYKAYTTEPVSFTVNGSDMSNEVKVLNINDNKEVVYTYTGAKEHGITVNIPEAKVMYGTTEGSYTLSECPTYKDVNAEGYTIYYKVTKTGYNPVKGSAKVVINKAPLTVTPDSGQTKVYGDADPAFTYTVSGLLGDDTKDVISGTLKRDTGENVTSEGYELSMNDDMTADNYDITCTSGVKFMITPRDIAEAVIILTQKKFEYKSETIDVAANGNISVKYNGTNVSTDDYVISGNTGKEKNKYKVTISGKRNFSGSVEKDWSITERIVPISNKKPEVVIEYGKEPTIITNLNGFDKDTDTITYGTSEDSVDETAINLETAGTYLIWYKVARDGFEPYEGFVTLIIEPKEVAIAWGETSLVYNGKIQAPTATVKAESLVGTDTCEVITSSTAKNVGIGYTATATSLSNSNYKLSAAVTSPEFEITPKSLTLKARNVSKYVGSKDPVLTYDAVGMCSGDTLSGVSVARDPGESVGSYQIRVSVDPAADNKNYTITMQSGVLVIKNHESNDEGSNGNPDGGSNGGGNSSGNTIPVVPVQKPVVLPIDALTANAANKNTKNTTGNNKGANSGADGINAETDGLLGTNGAGNLTLHLEVSEHSPIESASIETPVTKLLEGSDVFTTEEALAIKGGVDARVWVHIDKLDMSVVPDSVHDEILSAAKSLEDDNVELLYFDISLFKQIGDGEIINIHEPGTHIEITLELPESVINTDDKVVREYKILRLHDGVIDVIPTTYNPDTQTISFATDKFSTYVLAYIDKSAEEITEAENAASTDEISVSKVADDASSLNVWLFIIPVIIIAGIICAVIIYRKKREDDMTV